jgi:hypothetical protein
LQVTALGALRWQEDILFQEANRDDLGLSPENMTYKGRKKMGG